MPIIIVMTFIIRLPDDYQSQITAMALSGFDPYRMMSAKLAVEMGQFNEDLDGEYIHDESIWSYCDTIEGPGSGATKRDS
jgi:hypothetical protein